MFEEIINEVASEMSEVSYVEYVDETHAVVYFYSNSRKSDYLMPLICAMMERLAIGLWLLAHTQLQMPPNFLQVK